MVIRLHWSSFRYRKRSCASRNVFYKHSASTENMVTRPNSTSSAIGTVIVPYSWLCLRCIVAVRFIGYTPLCHGISKLYQPKRITLFWNPWLRQGQILSLFLSLLFYCSKPRNSSNSNSSGAVFSISFTVAKPLCSKNQSRSSFAISFSWNIAAHAHKKPLSKICCLLSFSFSVILSLSDLVLPNEVLLHLA